MLLRISLESLGTELLGGGDGLGLGLAHAAANTVAVAAAAAAAGDGDGDPLSGADAGDEGRSDGVCVGASGSQLGDAGHNLVASGRTLPEQRPSDAALPSFLMHVTLRVCVDSE